MNIRRVVLTVLIILIIAGLVFLAWLGYEYIRASRSVNCCTEGLPQSVDNMLLESEPEEPEESEKLQSQELAQYGEQILLFLDQPTAGVAEFPDGLIVKFITVEDPKAEKLYSVLEVSGGGIKQTQIHVAAVSDTEVKRKTVTLKGYTFNIQEGDGNAIVISVEN